MHTFKRIVASFLTLAMLLSEIPTWALAEMPEEESPAAQVQLEESEATEASGEETEVTSQETSEPEPSGDENDVSEMSDMPMESGNAADEPVISDGMVAEPEDTPVEEPDDLVSSDENMEESEENIGEAVTPSEGPQDALEWDLDGDGLLTITGIGEMGETPWYELMDSVTAIAIGEGVTSICEEAFAGYPNLTQVILPNSLQTIGTRAFRDCVQLNNVYIPAGVTSIESGAFSGCTGMEFFRINAYDVSIAEDAFTGVSAEVAISRDIPGSLCQNYGGNLVWIPYSKHIDSGLYGTHRWTLDEHGTLELFGPGVMESQASASGYPWYQYVGMIQLVYLRFLENVPDRAFAGYTVLNNLQMVGVGEIGAAAFSGCTALNAIWINGLTEIAGDAFSGVTAQVNYQNNDGWEADQMLDYGGNLTWETVYSGQYGDSIFWEVIGSELGIYRLNSGTTVENGTSAADYPWYAYRDQICTALISSVALPDYALDGYSNLETVTLYQPASVGSCAFRNCSSVKTVFFQGTAPAFIAEDAFTGVTATVEYMEYSGWTQEAMQNYGGNLTWKIYVWEEPELTSGTHGDNATWKLGTGGTLTVTGEGEMLAMESSEDYPWYAYRDQIEWIKVDGLTSIADFAFADGTTVRELDIGASVTKVGSKILAGSEAVEWVEFMGAPPAIAADAFEGLSNATLLYPYSCMDLWTETIEQTYGGTNVHWSWLTKMLDGGMVGDKGRWDIQENYSMSFYPNMDGDTFAMPEMEAGSYPWSKYADQAIDVHFQGITSVGANAFQNFTALEGVSFQDALSSIGSKAFDNCNTLERITFWGSVDSIAEDTFTGVTATVYYGAADWPEEKRKNYGGNLTWEETDFWIDGGMLDGISWNIYSGGDLHLYAEEETAMPELSSAEEYPWHSYRQQITSVSFYNITSIGSYAFADCTGLTEFVFDIYITALGNNIFEGCTNLKKLTFQGNAPEFSENTFYGLTATVVMYPSAHESWTDDKLQDYGGKITWPGEEEEEPDIGGECGENLTWTLDEDGVLTVSGTGAMSDFMDMVYDEENGWYYFETPWYQYGDQITEVVLDTGVTYVGINAFAGAYENIETVYLSETVESIGTGAFIGGSLTAFVVAEDSPYLSARDGVLFDRNQTALLYYPCGKTDAAYTVPEGVTRIADNIFNGAYGLSEVTIPATVEEIGRISGASLTDIHVDPENENYCSVDGVLFSKQKNVLIHYPNAKEAAEYVIPDGVTRIQMLAVHCDNLEHLTVPESVTYIGLNAFAGVDEITFAGNAPTFDVGEGSFSFPGVPVTVYYPANNDTWTEEVRQSYGDHITWVSYSDDIASGECGENLTWVLDKEGTLIISGTGEMKPNYLSQMPWVDYKNQIRKVEIQDGATSIIEYGFKECTNLQSVVIPGSVESIGYGAFVDCTGLSDVTIGNGVSHIDSFAFRNCESLTNVTIPGSVTSIGENVFSNCVGLKEATIGSCIGVNMFRACGALTDVTIEAGVTEIGSYAFYQCTSLINVSIPDSVAYIGDNAFNACTSLKVLDIPDGVIGIGNNAFGNCRSLISVTIPDSVTDLGGYVFYDCEKLTNVTFGAGIHTINAGSFLYCEALTEVTIPDNVTSIGESAFEECTALVTVALPDKLTDIGGSVFAGCTSLCDITLPESLTWIGDGAFVLSGISSVTIPDTVTSIGTNVFASCTNLTDVTIPNSVTDIGDCAFYNCSSLEEITIPASVSSLGGYVFGWCSNLASITMEGDAPAVGEKTFEKVTATVYYPANNPTWTEEVMQDYGGDITWTSYTVDIASGECGVELTWRITDDGTMIISGTGNMFDYDNNMLQPDWYWDAAYVKKIVIEEGVTSVGAYAFYGDFAGVTEIILPDSLVTIGSHSFEDCKNVTELNFGSKLESIGAYAFISCGLTGTLTLPDSLKTISTSAFQGSRGLTALDLGDGLEYIGIYAFGGCSGLTGSVTIPAGVTWIGEDAFNFCSGLEEIRFECVDCPTITNNNLGTLSGLKRVYVPSANYGSYRDFLANLPASVEILTDYDTAPVTGLKTNAVYSRTIVLSWDAHDSDQVVSYSVLRDGEEVMTLTECSYTDRALDSGTYRYSIVANYPEGFVTEESESITVTTVEPEISGMTGFTEYAGIAKVAEGFSTLYIQIPDKGNLIPLDDQEATVSLRYSDGQTISYLGQAQVVSDQSTDTTKVFCYEWDVSTLSDGEYTIIAALVDVDNTAAEYSKTVTVDNTPPAKLQQLVVNGTEETVQLSWTRAEEYDTVGYRIYRAVGEQTDFVQLAQIDNAATLSYTDTTAEESLIYRYYVVGVDIFGRESREYDVVGGSRIIDTVKPRVIQLRPVSGTYLKGEVTFSVKAEDNVAVTGTKLEYSVDQGTTWTAVPAAENGYRLNTSKLADGEIQIRAFAYDAKDNESDAFIQFYRVDNTGPEQVTGVTYESTSVTMTLRWENVADEDIGWFRVEQRQANGTYQTVADKVTALGINLQGLTPNTKYIYRVTAYDVLGNAGPASALCTASTALDTTAPVLAQILPASGVFSSVISLSATVRDDYRIASAALEYSLDGITWTVLHSETYKNGAASQKISGELDLTKIPEGLIYVRATAVDHAGNVNTDAPFVQHMVDKTAPAVPEGVKASGYNGYVEIRWNSAPDVASYQVYRAESEGGTYVPLSENVSTLNWFDRNVEDGATYYYKVSAKDAAGNQSAFSDVVSGTANADTQAPVVMSIAPADGGVLSGTYAEVSALAKDNSKLCSVLLEYSHDGDAYTMLTQRLDIDSYGDTVSARIPVEEFAHGDTVYLRVTAADYANNISTPVLRSYTVDKQAPAIHSVSAVYSDETVILNWTGGAETDLAGYRIYRRNAEGNSTLVAQIPGEVGVDAYTWTDGDLPASGGTFFYQLEAVDTVGNTATASSSGLEAPSVVIPAQTGPKALLTCDTVMTQGVEYIVDGSGSTDDGQILSYTYDFGDGCIATGKTVIHAYTAEGTYTLRLTVTDDDGQSHTVSKKVSVKAADLVGTVEVRIVDEKGAPVPNAPVYFDLGEEEQVIRGTDSHGYVTFSAAVGRHTVGCVIMNNQWLPVKRDLIVNAGKTTSVSMTLINKPIVEGTFEIKRMTLEEIEAAGIDLTDPENQYYVEVELHLEYGNKSIDLSVPGGNWNWSGWTYPPIIIGSGEKYKPKKDDDDDPDPIFIDISDEDDEPRGWWPVLIDKSEDPKVMILDIPIGVQSLKEMFDVRLHILNNASSEFSMLDNIITLNTPSGLSVVTDAYMANQQKVYVPEIKGQTQTTVDWIVRGDQPGEYYVNADYTGILSQFNEPLTARFEAGTPIQVYGMTGLKLVLEVAEELENGTLYYNVRLENNGEVDIYKPSISTDDELIEMELYDATGTLTAESGEDAKQIGVQSLSALPDILKVDNSLLMHYMCIDQTEYTHCIMRLEEKVAEYTNTYGLEDVEIVVKPLDYFRKSFSTTVNAKDKAELTFYENTSAYNQIMNNRFYVYVPLATGKLKEHVLNTNVDEFTWTAAREGIIAAFTDDDKEDKQQIRSLITQVVEMSADTVDELEHDKVLTFISKLLGVVGGRSVKSLLGEYAVPLEEALNELYLELVDGGYLAQSGNNYALQTLIFEKWKDKVLDAELSPLSDIEASERFNDILKDVVSEDVFEMIGLSQDTASLVKDLAKNISVDIEWIIKAQAKEDGILLCLKSMIKAMEKYELNKSGDNKAVYDEMVDMYKALDDLGIAYVVLSNLKKTVEDFGAEKVLKMGKDKLMTSIGLTGDPFLLLLTGTLKLTVYGVDALSNVSGQHDMADNIRFIHVISEAARLSTLDARYKYNDKKTTKNAADYMQLLRLMINVRAAGESQVALYGKSFETDFTVGNMPLLKAVRSATNAESATSWYQWRDIVEDRISRLRVQLLKNPLTTEVTGREKPTVSFDYSNGQTLQSFDETFEYSLDMGENWTPCEGSPIAVEAPEVSKELWVRKIDRKNTDMTGTGAVTINGPISLSSSQIEVVKTPDGYEIHNLDPEKAYQLTFSESAMDYDSDMVLDIDVTAGSDSYSYHTETIYNYVYIRAKADRNGYASSVAELGIRNLVYLNLYVSGEGTIGDDDGAYTYGDTVSLSAVPAYARYFDGWYRGGVKVSSDPYYTFTITSTMYLEARFLRTADVSLPDASGEVDPDRDEVSATTEDGTVVTVSGIPEAAYFMVVKTVTDDQIIGTVQQSLGDLGAPVKVYDIDLLDENKLPLGALEGKTVTLDYSGSLQDVILCGVSEGSAATILASKAENGQITFDTDSSQYYVLTKLPADRKIAVSVDKSMLFPGDTANNVAKLTAEFLPFNTTETTIVWSLAEGDEVYAALKTNGNTAQLTALKATGARTVIVTASAADGSFPSTAVEIQVIPLVHQLKLMADGEDVTGKKISVDINREMMLELQALVAPEGASQDLEWTSSNEAVAAVDNGWVTFTGETKTVTITAKATDGSRKSASVTIMVVALPQNLEMAEDSVTELVGGASASFKAVDIDTEKPLTSTQIAWSLDEEYAPFASITVAGMLTTRAVAEETQIVIVGRVLGNEEIAFVEHTVTLYPKATNVEISYGDDVVNGQTILVDTENAEESALTSVMLDAMVYPHDAMRGVTWKSSSPAIADVDENGLVTVKWDALKSAAKTGTVTITATTVDGSRSTASVKLNFGVFVKQILIEAPEQLLRSGESTTLLAETVPAVPTKAGVTWSLKNSEDKDYATITAAGRLTAKTVYGDHTVIVVATAKDGSGITDEMPVKIMPKTDGILTVYSGGKNVTKTTMEVDLNTTNTVDLSAYTLGDELPEYGVKWTSSAPLVAAVDYDEFGNATVTVNKIGAATIKAVAPDGRNTTVTLKGVKKTSDITVSVKNGDMTLASGKYLTLQAAVQPSDATVKTVLWSVAEEDAAYATITAGGRLTAAKNLTERRTITVIAETKDGGAKTSVEVDLMPLAVSAGIFLENDEPISNVTLVHDMAENAQLQLVAKVYPLEQAREDVTWSSSGSRVASVDENGLVTCHKAGTVTITATTNDGSRVKASFKLTVVKKMTELTLPKTAVVASGKSLTMSRLKDYFVDPDATNKNLIWSMEGEGAAFATLSAAGVLVAQKVTEPKSLIVTATAADGSGTAASCQVTIHPATTKVQILHDGEVVTQTLTLEVGETLDLDGISLPITAANAYTWKSSAAKYAEVDEDGVVTALVGGKTISINCAAADGSGKSAVVKIQTVSTIRSLALPPTAIIAVGRNLTLKPAILPVDATNQKLTWSIENDASGKLKITNGVLTTLGATAPATVTVVAKTTDGSNLISRCQVTIYPATASVEIRKDGAAAPVSMKMKAGETFKLDAAALPTTAAQQFLWTSSNEAAVRVDPDGTVTAVTAGKIAVITCSAVDGSGRRDTISITVQ